MECCQEHKIKSILSFNRDEILYDIANCAYIEGDVLKSENEHDRHQITDVCEDGNIDRVDRILELAYSECVEMLYPYSKQSANNNERRNNHLREVKSYEILMQIPETFSKTTLTLLERLIHEYMVSCVLADWMSLTNADSEANWEEKMKSLKNKIQTALMSRTGKIRRRCKPF